MLERPSVVTPGNHDGVHLGHRALIDAAKQVAKARGQSAVSPSDITDWLAEVKYAFDPAGIFNPGNIVDPAPMDVDWRYYFVFHPLVTILAAVPISLGGLGIRALVDGKEGRQTSVVSTSDLAPEAVERMAQEAVALARATAADPSAGLPEGSSST